MGDIKRQLEPNLCRRACLMASLYGIERDGCRKHRKLRWRLHRRKRNGSVPLPPAFHGWTAPIGDIAEIDKGREKAQTDWNIGYKWFGNYDPHREVRETKEKREGERCEEDAIQSLYRNSPRGRYAGIFGPDYTVAFPTRGSQNFVPHCMLRPVMNQKWTGDVSLDAHERYRPGTSPANLRSHTWWRLYIISELPPIRRQSCAPSGFNVNDARSRPPSWTYSFDRGIRA